MSLIFTAGWHYFMYTITYCFTIADHLNDFESPKRRWESLTFRTGQTCTNTRQLSSKFEPVKSQWELAVNSHPRLMGTSFGNILDKMYYYTHRWGSKCKWTITIVSEIKISLFFLVEGWWASTSSWTPLTLTNAMHPTRQPNLKRIEFYSGSTARMRVEIRRR